MSVNRWAPGDLATAHLNRRVALYATPVDIGFKASGFYFTFGITLGQRSETVFPECIKKLLVFVLDSRTCAFGWVRASDLEKTNL